jgi:Calcineurin-like phosphoesterase
MTDPSLVGMTGDWHCNQRWAKAVIPQIARQLSDEDPRIILHAGDFGIWRQEEKYETLGRTYYALTFLDVVTEALENSDAYLWFADGNHEDHPYLKELAYNYALRSGKCILPDEDTEDYGWITPRIRWLPRGTRWQWNGRTWLALGGAVSVDKNLRDAGVSWFPEEEITDEQEARVIAGGPADVILSHDAPACEPLPLRVPPLEWLPMIPAAEAHRARLQRVGEAVKPGHWFHGHYHMAKQSTMRSEGDWGHCRFTALDMDETRFNWGLVDTRTMDFFIPEEIRKA